ncbi:MAG: T9SS type A sorting domain-containing protein [Bacteroidia bacterium]|nr:T9SS type A sorting domain-containing protein [Bacteroidia bacterium]
MKQFFSTVFLLVLCSCLFAQSYNTTLKYNIVEGVGADTLKVYITNNTGSDVWLGGVHWGVKLSSSSAATSGTPIIRNDDLDAVLQAGAFKQPTFQDYSDTDPTTVPPSAITSVTIDGVVYDKRLDFTTSPGLGVIFSGGSLPLFTVSGSGADIHLLDFVIERIDPLQPVHMILEGSDDINNNFFTNSITPIGSYSVNLTDYDVAPQSSATFPVELLDFDAYQIGEGTVQLDWTTAVEINNAEFQIERSIDARFFEQIGSVAGAGNSNSPKSYDYLDFSAPNSKIYYRLRQVDIDGTFTYSPVREVLLGDKFAPKFDIYPNPAKEYVNIDAAVSSDRLFEVKLLDMSGRVIFHDSRVTLGEETYRVDVSNLTPQNYILQFVDDQEEVKHSEIIRVIE